MPVFRCEVTPISLDLPTLIRMNERIRAVRSLETLEEALFYLPNHPIGADVTKEDCFLGYHAVIIESVFQLLGDLVAVCRMLNGEDVAHSGYAYVSLTTMYMIVGVDTCQEPYIRKTPRPMHLLSNFVIQEMHRKSEKSQEDSSIIGSGDIQNPIINQDERTGSGMPISKDFLKGADKNVSPCLFDHPKDMDGAEPIRQEMPKNHNVDAHDQQQNPQEQIQSDNDQIKPTVQSKYKD